MLALPRHKRFLFSFRVAFFCKNSAHTELLFKLWPVHLFWSKFAAFVYKNGMASLWKIYTFAHHSLLIGHLKISQLKIKRVFHRKAFKLWLNKRRPSNGENIRLRKFSSIQLIKYIILLYSLFFDLKKQKIYLELSDLKAF